MNKTQFISVYEEAYNSGRSTEILQGNKRFLAEKTTNKNKWEPRENLLKLGTEICKIMQILQSVDAAIHHPIRHRVMLKMLSTVLLISTATQLDFEKATNKVQKVILFGEAKQTP